MILILQMQNSISKFPPVSLEQMLKKYLNILANDAGRLEETA
jgi:hypothetical protein